MSFEARFVVGWAQVDANGHLRNSAFLDLASDTRMLYFAAHGFPMREFARLRIGPVVLRDEIDYTRELHLLDEVRVTLALAGITGDAGRFRLRNGVFRGEEAVAQVTSTVGWLDLDRRWLAPAPEPLAALLRALPRTGDFAPLPSRAQSPAAE